MIFSSSIFDEFLRKNKKFCKSVNSLRKMNLDFSRIKKIKNTQGLKDYQTQFPIKNLLRVFSIIKNPL